MSEPTFPRAFVVQRDADVSGVSGEGIVAEGVLFSDGWAVTHWLDKPPMHEPKTDVWHNPGVQPFERVHGHGGATRVIWADDIAPVVAQLLEQLLEQRNRAQAAADRAYKLADRWEAAHGSAHCLVRSAGAELHDVLDEATGTGCDNTSHGPHVGFTCAEVDQSKPYWTVRWGQEHNWAEATEETVLLRNHVVGEGSEHDATHAVPADHCVENAALRTRAEQAEELLSIAHDTSNRSEAERARAVQRADQAMAAIKRVSAVGPELEYEATAPGMAEPAREVLRDAARRIRAALNGPEQHGRATATEATEPHPCGTYLPPTTPEDSGLCARCGMYDYRHRTDTKERP